MNILDFYISFEHGLVLNTALLVLPLVLGAAIIPCTRQYHFNQYYSSHSTIN